MLQWRIHYDNGSTFSNLLGEPAAAPATGIAAIVQRTDCDHHPVEWLKQEPQWSSERPIEILEDAGWYWWRADKRRWMRGDLIGFLDQAMHCGAQWLKQGRCLTHEAYETMLTAVGNDALEE